MPPATPSVASKPARRWRSRTSGPLAAATLATFAVVVGLTGEHGERNALLRRVGVVAAILLGAVLGASLVRWEPWSAWAAIAVVVSGVGGLARPPLARTRAELPEGEPGPRTERRT